MGLIEHNATIFKLELENRQCIIFRPHAASDCKAHPYNVSYIPWVECYISVSVLFNQYNILVNIIILAVIYYGECQD